MKEYLKLDAFEVGQIWGIVSLEKDRLSPGLKQKLEDATSEIYLDSGFTPKQVFGDKNWKTKHQEYLDRMSKKS